MIVLDTSVVLARFLREPGGEVFTNLAEPFAIYSVNAVEIATKLNDAGQAAAAIRAALLPLHGNCHPLTEAQAIQAGLLRGATGHLGLSLGDRCCLALGQELWAEVWTAERKWAGLDLGVRVRLIR